MTVEATTLQKPKIEIKDLIRDLLTSLGEDPHREGLLRTPARVERSLSFLTQGYRENLEQFFQEARFVEAYDEMVLVKEIDFFSLCEHHLIPFFGKCHVAYLPNGKIVGLSKIVRMIEIFSKRLQVQERLTREIASSIEQHLQPRGVAVVMEATHLCMVMRGIKKEGTLATTSSMLGAFRSGEATRAEFLSLIRG